MRQPTLRLLICGGRDYEFTVADIQFLNTYLNIYDVVEVVHGGAAGADSQADEWARFHDLKVRVFPADWRKFGKQAGPLRNTDMADYMARFHFLGDALLVLAFPGGRGTADMVAKAKARDLPVLIVSDEIKKREAEGDK